MLKAAGVDQFSITERLRTLDTEYVDHLTRLYQRQSALVAHRVDELRWVESFLVGSGWSRDLDEILPARLPLPEGDVAAALGAPVSLDRRDARGSLRSLARSSSSPDTSLLAAIALVRHGWVLGSEQSDRELTDLAQSGFHSPEPRIVDETALAFGHWRSVFAPVRLFHPDTLVRALHSCTDREQANVALRLLGGSVEVDTKLLADLDPDKAFGAALALVTPEPLVAALADPQRRRAAGLVLASNGYAAPLGRYFKDFDDETLSDILDWLHRNDEPYPTLRDELWNVTQNRDPFLRRGAARLIVTIGLPQDAQPLIDLDVDDISLVQDVIQRMELAGPDIYLVSRYLVTQRRFSLSQYGVQTLAESNRLPDDFVPEVWRSAVDDEQRRDLLRFAEEQLYARGDEALHRWILNVVFAHEGSTTAFVREEAWWSLLRWYGRETHASKGPLVLNAPVITTFFAAGVKDFVERFLAALLDAQTAEHLTLEECLGHLLRYSPEEGLPSIVAEADAFDQLVRGLTTVLADDSRRSTLRCDIVRFFENIVRSDRAMFDRVIEILTPHGTGDLEFEITTTISRVRGE